MSKFKFVLDKGGVRELMKSAAMQQECMQYAGQAAARAGEGFAAETRMYPERSGAAVRAESKEAYYRNLHSNILLKCIGGGK